MTPEIAAGLIIVAFWLWLVLFLIGTGAGHRAGVAPPAGPPQPAPKPAHVHTFTLASTEETGGHTIHVYRCTDCPELQRWVTSAES